MQVSLNWLSEFVDLSDTDEKQIAHELTIERVISRRVLNT